MAYLQRDVSVGEYMRSTRDAGVGFVSVTDRRAVVDYLSGKGSVDGPEGRVVPLVTSSTSTTETVDTKLDTTITTTTTTSSSSTTKRPLSPSTTLPSNTTLPTTSIVKKARYTVDKSDQIKVKKILNIMEGPSFGNTGSAGEVKGDKTGGAFKNRETVLRGERMNVGSHVLFSSPCTSFTYLIYPSIDPSFLPLNINRISNPLDSSSNPESSPRVSQSKNSPQTEKASLSFLFSPLLPTIYQEPTESE